MLMAYRFATRFRGLSCGSTIEDVAGGSTELTKTLIQLLHRYDGLPLSVQCAVIHALKYLAVHDGYG